MKEKRLLIYIKERKGQIGFLIADIINKAIPFIASPIIIDKFGDTFFSSYINTALLFNLFLYLIGGGLQSKIIVDMSNNRSFAISIYNATLICLLSYAVFLLFFNIANIDLVNDKFGINVSTINYLLLSGLIGSFLLLINSKNQYDLQFTRYGLIQTSPPALLVILTIYTGNINFSYLLSYGLIFIILLPSTSYYNFTKFKVSKSILLETLFFYSGQQIHLISTWLKLSIDRLILSALVSLTVSAKYSVILQVAMIMSVIMVSLNKYWAPQALKALNSGKDITSMKNRFIRNATLIYCQTLVFGCGYIALFFDRTYLSTLYLLPIVAGAYLLQGFYLTESVHIFQTGKTYKLILPSILSTIAHISLSLLLIPQYQAIGAAVSLLSSWFLLFILTKFSVKSSVHI